ncbi:MAG: APC family permease [Acidobacteria bacterium]|nr:APC family permease [Acidobacteriota bacterium]
MSQITSSDNSPSEPSSSNTRHRIVVATSVMLSFISFWRAAAIVLNDLASTAFYIGGITEEAIGKAAPWFVLAVILFASAVRAVYVESCTMFVRGGVYRVVKEAMGGTLAKLAVSALIFDYILTGPISSVSAGQYIAGLLNSTLAHFGIGFQLPVNFTACVLAIGVVLYFWRLNIIGIHESSERALRIMQITGVMVVVIVLWCLATLIAKPQLAHLPPLPLPSNLHFETSITTGLHPLGWLKDTTLPSIGFIGLMIAFGHSVLAMSGEESLAQISREIEHPKLKNLIRAAIVIFAFTICFTPVVSFFAVMIIPDDVRIHEYSQNLLSGLAMHVIGPEWLKLLLQAFVVIVGFLILSGAVNTAIVGSNGVLNRVSEDGVLTAWFRAPQKKYGTTYRIINMVAVLQIVIILLSRGNTIFLGEAYAFGVIWSFTFMTASIALLRFKRPGPREWRVPLNLKIGKVEIPVGILIVALILLSLALTNLLTKELATISGVTFTLAFFITFTLSERANLRRQKTDSSLDQFNLVSDQTVSRNLLDARPGGVMVTARDYNSLHYLKKALQDVDTDEQDVVVMTARILQGPGGSDEQMYEDELFTDYEQLLFTRAVAVAEKMGKKIKLLVVPSNDAFQATVRTAIELECSTLVAGVSTKMPADQQAKAIGDVWEAIQHPGKRKLRVLKLINPDGSELTYELGAHRPNVTPEDIELTHRLWLELAKDNKNLHHNQVVSVALRRLAKDMHSEKRSEVISEIQRFS